MRALSELPSRWQNAVADYLDRRGAEYRQISVADFVNDVRIVFEDGSTAHFNYAFYLADDVANEIAVFTEHCGYHVFPFCIERIETIGRNGAVLKNEAFVID